ncbi:MAG: hypothetical protein BAJATHORv1_20124 [Candidatus Thorarchaeota archaeon]|nr:MAG: hypothetical protein BAJATHORv1_20124 [Candidatus Thorarchaeota archaeon]
MIRNIIILDDAGTTLFIANFGECHSFGDNPESMAGFISALHSFGHDLSGSGVDEIQFGGLYLILLHRQDLIFAIAADDDAIDKHKMKLGHISDLFIETFDADLAKKTYRDDMSIFSSFRAYLLEKNLVMKNCGKNEDCSICPNRDKTLPLEDIKESTRIH